MKDKAIELFRKSFCYSSVMDGELGGTGDASIGSGLGTFAVEEFYYIPQDCLVTLVGARFNGFGPFLMCWSLQCCG